MTEEMQLFLEDMDEQLSIMESALLDISDSSLEDIDKEVLNSIFRAMHTMKGNAGIFGYELITNFAHSAESLLDEIRNGNIKLTDEMVELFLQVNDHSKILINRSIKNESLDEQEEKQHEYLSLELLNYLDNKQPALEESKEQKDSDKTLASYTIDVKLNDQFFTSGMDMQSIIKYLDAIGKVKKLDLNYEDIPYIDELDPLKAYVFIHMEYETSEPYDEIEEAFEFVCEDIELDIKLIEDKQKEVPKKDFFVFDKNKGESKDSKEEKNKDFVVFKNKNVEEKEKIQKDTPEQSSSLLGNSYTLKVDSSKVDKLINQISEMVIANAKITQYSLNTKDPELEEAVDVMSDMLEEIRDGIMNIRMVQVGDSLSKLRRIVNDNAKKMGKEIGFEIVGGETELDKTVIEKISDPLVHILRNSVDHGIEEPEIRKQKGKSTKGTIVLKAYPDSGSIVIEIIDDGNGIDKNQIFNKAVERNLISPNEHLSDSEIYNLIFMPGFSTASEITDLSGRGVGMDVVKRNIEDLRGTVDVISVLDKGTTITIRLPLTLAIIDGFLVESAGSKFIIPLDNIQECIELTSSAKQQLNSKGYITLRSSILPILDVAKHFELDIKDTKRENIVVVQYGKSKVGLKVDKLHGEYQTVIKPLGDIFKNVVGFSGGTILGDGEVALIFDVQKLIEYKITKKEG